MLLSKSRRPNCEDVIQPGTSWRPSSGNILEITLMQYPYLHIQHTRVQVGVNQHICSRVQESWCPPPSADVMCPVTGRGNSQLKNYDFNRDSLLRSLSRNIVLWKGSRVRMPCSMWQFPCGMLIPQSVPNKNVNKTHNLIFVWLCDKFFMSVKIMKLKRHASRIPWRSSWKRCPHSNQNRVVWVDSQFQARPTPQGRHEEATSTSVGDDKPQTLECTYLQQRTACMESGPTAPRGCWEAEGRSA